MDVIEPSVDLGRRPSGLVFCRSEGICPATVMIRLVPQAVAGI